jgi:hypothetical protein
MIKLSALSAVLALGLSTAAYCQVTGPAGQQDTNKQGYANPNTPNMQTNDNVMVVPAPAPDASIEYGTVGSAVGRPVQVEPAPMVTTPERSIDGSAAAPAGK